MKLRLTGFAPKPLLVGTALLFSSLLGAGLSVVATSPEAVVARSFTAALENGGSHAASQAHTAPLIAGTEEFWLAQKRKATGDGSKLEPAAWDGAGVLSLAVGDRVSISKGGATRVLEVVSVSDLTPPQTGAVPAGQHQLLVTCRDITSANGDLVTFVTGGANTAQFKRPQAL